MFTPTHQVKSKYHIMYLFKLMPKADDQVSTTTETELAVQISTNNIPYDLTTWSPIFQLPPMGFSVSTGVSSVTSPSYTSLVSLIRSPMARRKFSIRTSVFLISVEYTSLPTIGQKGTLLPSS